MRAKMAFRRGTVIRINVDGVVRAGLHTRFAAYTALGAEVDNTVFALVHRGHGADRDARRIFAMITARDLKNAAGVGIGSLLNVLHPSAVYSQRNVVFRLTGNGAGVASDALSIVDDESIAHAEGESQSTEQLSGVSIVADESFQGSYLVEQSSEIFWMTPIALWASCAQSWATIQGAFQRPSSESVSSDDPGSV